jgi:ROS/MUCR transcriptional regulator protein
VVAEIVSRYVAKNSVGVDQVAGLIATVHRTLSGLGESAPVPAALEPAVPIRRSVQHDHVVCLECGFRGKFLRRHLRLRMGSNRRRIASAGSCQLITRSLHRPIQNGVRRWQRRLVLVEERRTPPCRRRLLK